MNHGLFRLVAPALVPLVEGIASDFLHAEWRDTRRLRHKEITTRLGEVPEDAAIDAGYDAVSALFDQLDEEFLAESDFERERSGVRQRRVLNRHILLHDRGARQGSRANALRAFLIVETLGSLVLAYRRDAAQEGIPARP